MARPRKNQMKICTVTGVTTSVDNFYRNQSHVKAVDNIRRNTSTSKEQLKRMFNQLNAY
jgi:uridine phosphorylase